MQTPGLIRSSTRRVLWGIFIAVLVLTVVAELLVVAPSHEGLAGTFGFGSWFGFVACAVLILFAKGLGVFLERPDTYYEKRDD